MQIENHETQLKISSNEHVAILDYDQQAGLFTEAEWIESINELGLELDTSDVDLVLVALGNTSNTEFFSAS